MRHLIKKQIIELSLDKRLNYYHVQQQVSNQYWNEMVPLLEKAFDAISNEDVLLEIDQFELDLGMVTEKEIGNEEWTREIKKKIEERLAQVTDPASPYYAVKSRDRRLGIFSQWLYYMEHGYLAWNTGQPNDKWYRDVLEALAVDSKSYVSLKREILQDPSLLKRIVSQHPDYFLHKLTEIITAQKQESLPDYVDELLLLYRYLAKRKKIEGNKGDKELRNDLWQSLLKWASRDSPYSATTKLSVELVHSFVEEHAVTIKIPDATAATIPVILPLLNRYSDELKNRRKKEKKQINDVIQDLNILNKTEKGLIDEIVQISKYNVQALDEEGVFIVHAGVVLLHPFLKSLFGRLEFVSGNSFTSETAQQNGLYLIHYLSTGLTEAQEFELTLAKILCAYPLEKPVEFSESLAPEITMEADIMLEAAIDEWKILKNTSLAGLREGFLQRPGKLFSRNGNLYLQVEKNAIDVLLDYLPWNLSMVILPWMKDILRVEWR